MNEVTAERSVAWAKAARAAAREIGGAERGTGMSASTASQGCPIEPPADIARKDQPGSSSRGRWASAGGRPAQRATKPS